MLLTDFSHSHFTVSYRDALDRFRVQLNIILLNGICLFPILLANVLVPGHSKTISRTNCKHIVNVSDGQRVRHAYTGRVCISRGGVSEVCRRTRPIHVLQARRR